jgi:hypothetical protein
MKTTVSAISRTGGREKKKKTWSRHNSSCLTWFIKTDLIWALLLLSGGPDLEKLFPTGGGCTVDLVSGVWEFFVAASGDVIKRFLFVTDEDAN